VGVNPKDLFFVKRIENGEGTFLQGTLPKVHCSKRLTAYRNIYKFIIEILNWKTTSSSCQG